jgi:hypothetical protein
MVEQFVYADCLVLSALRRGAISSCGPVTSSTPIQHMASTLIDCPACQNRISSVASSCPRCGHPTRAQPPANLRVDCSGPPAPRPNDKLAVAGMIAGVLSVLDIFIPGLSWAEALPGIAAIVLSAMGLARIRRGETGGLGLAVAGLVTGVVGLVVFVLAFVGLSIVMLLSGS